MIFETKADVDNLRELRRRKLELSAQIKAERTELNETVQEIKADLTPARIIQNTLGAFRRPMDNGLLPAIFGNPTGLRLVAGLAITTLLGRSRPARILKAVVPVAIQVLPVAMTVLPGVVKLVKNIWRSRRQKSALKREKKQWETTEYGVAHRNGV